MVSFTSSYVTSKTIFFCFKRNLYFLDIVSFFLFLNVIKEGIFVSQNKLVLNFSKAMPFYAQTLLFPPPARASGAFGGDAGFDPAPPYLMQRVLLYPDTATLHTETDRSNPFPFYLLRSNQPLDPATVTAESITHSPTSRYLFTHFLYSLFSTPLVLRLGLASHNGSRQPLLLSSKYVLPSAWTE